MGEKVYKPIMNTGDHLVQSKDNPDRVRGLTLDMNNQNPGIPEWEELDLEDLVPSQQACPINAGGREAGENGRRSVRRSNL